MPLVDFSSRVISIFEIRGLYIACLYFNCLRDCSIFQLVSLRQILVDHTNGYFCERLNINILVVKLYVFTIVILTWYAFVSYSIVLPM